MLDQRTDLPFQGHTSSAHLLTETETGKTTDEGQVLGVLSGVRGQPITQS